MNSILSIMGWFYIMYFISPFLTSTLTATHPSANQNTRHNITPNTRFIIYDVKNGEGFNARRHVYIRAANLVRHMIDRGEDWILVLPPWRHMFHWKSHYVMQEGLKWNSYFDVESMNLYVPVMEFDDFIKLDVYDGIDHLLYLQWHPDGISPTAGLANVIRTEECRNLTYYNRDEDGLYRGYFWSYENVYAKKRDCVSVGGYANVLADFLKKLPSRTFLVLHMEQVAADNFGSAKYFKPRRSQMFAKHLRMEGDNFRLKYLNSNDVTDKTPLNNDWRRQIPLTGSALGGPYLGLHMRRGDFTYAHKSTIPSIEEIGREVKKKLDEYQLNKIYIATDGMDNEIQELKKNFDAEIHRFPRTHDVIRTFTDGGVAIIDQWIVAHARYFIGTCESTFSFSIHEERDILGFDYDTTYNCICGHQSPEDECSQPSRWTVMF